MDDVMLEKLTRWIEEIPYQAFLDCAKARPPGLGKDPQFLGLQRDMRALVPVPGDTWVHDIDVLIEPGQDNHQGQRRHSHPEWTVVFYVDPGTPVVPIMVERDNAVLEISPAPGDAVVLPPDTIHWVAPNNTEGHRLSFAMLVAVPGKPSKYL